MHNVCAEEKKKSGDGDGVDMQKSKEKQAMVYEAYEFRFRAQFCFASGKCSIIIRVHRGEAFLHREKL